MHPEGFQGWKNKNTNEQKEEGALQRNLNLDQ